MLDRRTQMQDRPKLVGINHIALEVGNLEEALDFYGRIFEVKLRGRIDHAAFVDMGDQFIALMEGPVRDAGGHRHFGLVVDDGSAVRKLARAAGAELLDEESLDFRDPWGNWVQVVEYSKIQLTKADHVLIGMGLQLTKSESALRELAEKNMAPPGPPRVS